MKNFYSKISLCALALLCASYNNRGFAQAAPPNGSCGTVINMDGINKYINITTPSNIPINNSNYTMEAWFYANAMTNNDGSQNGIIGWGNYGGTNQVNALRLDGSGGIYNYWWGNDLYASTGNISGVWHHVAATFDGTTRKLYLDGNLISSDNPGGHSVPNAANFAIGLTAPFLNEYFNGKLDEVRIWNVARTQSQIQASMNVHLIGNESGLVAYWKMDEGSGTTASSVTGGNAGTLTNMDNSSWRLSDGGYACGYLTTLPPDNSCETVLDFNPNNSQYVSVTSGVYFNGAFTIEAWVFPRSVLNWSRIIDFGNCAGCDNVLLSSTYGTSGAPGLYVEGYQFQATTALQLNKWNHVAATWSGGVGTIYVNGAFAGSASMPTPPQNVTRALNYIGKSNWGDPYLDGMLDEISIWNVALSQNQIQANMNTELNGNESGLVAYWNMNEGIGNYIFDKTSNNATGTIQNMNPITNWKLPNYSNPCSHTPPNNSCATALSFDGANKFVTSPAPLQATSGTWEAWVERDSWTPGNDDRLFGNGINYTSSNSMYFSLHPSVGLHFRYGGSPDGGNIYASSLVTQSLLPGSWHHLAATWYNNGSTTTINIYIDGNLAGSNSSSLVIANAAATFIAGDPVNPKFGPGKLDEVRIWNVARTQAQIRSSMNTQLNGNETGLVAYYNMNDGVNSPYALDKTANGYKGILRNMNTATDWVSPSGGVSGSKFYSTTATIPGGTNMLIGGVSRSTSGTYYAIGTSSGGCDSLQETILKIINTYSISASPQAFCAAIGTSTLTLSGSQTGLDYYFRNDVNDTVFKGPIAGSGSSLTIGTSTLTATTVFNVNASAPSTGLSFDGVNDYADAGTVLTTTTNNVALEAWFKWSGTSSGSNQYIVLNGTTCCSGYAIYLTSGGAINGLLGGVVSIPANVTAIAGQWTHVAFARGATQWGLYVNGILRATTNSSPNTPSGNFVIGANNSSGEFFNGVIDEVRVWTINRTATDIKYNMYNCFSGTETGLRATYKFEDGTNSAYAKDGSQYASYLTLRNMNTATAWVSGADVCSATSYEVAQPVSVYINPTPPTVTVNAAQVTICSGSSASLVASGANSYVWQPGNLIGTSISVSPASLQTYTVTGTNACGTDVKSEGVNVIPSPTAVIIGNTVFCSGASIAASGGVSYLWSTGSTVQTIVPVVSGIITLTATAANGCTNIQTANLTVNQTPIAAIGGNVALCGVDTTSLVAYGGTIYNWSTGANTQVAHVTTGVITVTVTTASGCQSSTSTSVTKNALPDILFTLPSNLQTLCSNLSSVSLTGGLPVGGTYSGVGVSGGLFFNPSVAGIGNDVVTYSVNNNICTNTATATIVVQSCSSTGIEYFSFEKNVVVYPNPANENLTIQSLVPATTNVVLKMIDTRGNEVYAETYTQQQGANTKTIDLTKLSKGIYLLQLKTDLGIANKKIVVE